MPDEGAHNTLVRTVSGTHSVEESRCVSLLLLSSKRCGQLIHGQPRWLHCWLCCWIGKRPLPLFIVPAGHIIHLADLQHRLGFKARHAALCQMGSRFKHSGEGAMQPIRHMYGWQMRAACKCGPQLCYWAASLHGAEGA